MRIDLIGIYIMIFVCTLTSVRAAFYAYPITRDSIMIIMKEVNCGASIVDGEVSS